MTLSTCGASRLQFLQRRNILWTGKVIVSVRLLLYATRWQTGCLQFFPKINSFKCFFAKQLYYYSVVNIPVLRLQQDQEHSAQCASTTETKKINLFFTKQDNKMIEVSCSCNQYSIWICQWFNEVFVFVIHEGFVLENFILIFWLRNSLRKSGGKIAKPWCRTEEGAGCVPLPGTRSWDPWGCSRAQSAPMRMLDH